MEILENDYQNLLLQLQKTLAETRETVTTIINKHKVETSWKMGQMIDRYLVESGTVGYGDQLFLKLEKDMSLSIRTLYQMHGFYKQYPTLPNDTALSWSHYKILSAIQDPVSRKHFQELAVNGGLGVRQLEKVVVRELPKKASPKTKVKTNVKESSPKTMPTADESALPLMRGNLFTYKIKSFPHKAKKMVDCGFGIFREVETEMENDVVVTSKKDDAGYSFEKYAKESSKLYTYKAYLERVVDGDTLRVVLDLGFETHHREILRLSGINAPEKGTSEGKKSTKALEEMLKDAPFLIIKTNKIDIYGRYIADVFVGERSETDAQKVADEGVYVSQKLLDLGVVKKY